MKKLALGIIIGLAAGLLLEYARPERGHGLEAFASATGLVPETPPTEGLYRGLDAGWAGAPLWDDGRAEVNLYEAVLNREQGPRKAAYAATVVVKEPFSPRYLVKADEPAAGGTFDVLKINYVMHARTGLYDWDEMISTFVHRLRLVPIKMTYSRQEWCGNIFKEWRRWRGQRSLFVSSYFDGQGTETIDLRLDDAVVPYDAVPLVLRALRMGEVGDSQTFTFPLYPTLRDTRVGPDAAVRATLTIGRRPIIRVPLGRFSALEVTLAYPTGRGDTAEERYWIETEPPNRILRVAGPNGEELALARSERLEYWRMTGDDVAWWPGQMLDERVVPHDRSR